MQDALSETVLARIDGAEALYRRSAHGREGACDAGRCPTQSRRNPRAVLGRDLRADRHDLCTDLS